jgi:thiamine-monophosphate kinase
LNLSRVIAKTGIINSGTDLSDGLGADLISLCEASKVGAIIFAEKIPISRRVKEIAIKNKIRPWFYAFTVGGDFQFIVTADKRYDDAIRKLGLVKIGRITRKRKTFISTMDGIVHMPNIGHRDVNISSFHGEIEGMILQLKSLAK